MKAVAKGRKTGQNRYDIGPGPGGCGPVPREARPLPGDSPKRRRCLRPYCVQVHAFDRQDDDADTPARGKLGHACGQTGRKSEQRQTNKTVSHGKPKDRG